VSSFPQAYEAIEDPQAEEEMGLLIETIVALRTIRSEMNVPPSQSLAISIRAQDDEPLERLERNRLYIERMVKADRVEIGKDTEKPPLSAFAVVRGVELFVPMDRPRMEEELKRLQKEIVKIEKEMAFVSRKLSNEQFIAKAPAHVVEEEREKAAQYEAIRAKLEESSRKIREVLG